MRTISREAHNRSLAGLCAGKIRNVADILSKSSWEVAFESPSLDVDESWNVEFPVNRLISFLLCFSVMGVRTTTTSDDRGEGVLASWLLSSLSSLCIEIQQKVTFGTCSLLVGSSVWLLVLICRVTATWFRPVSERDDSRCWKRPGDLLSGGVKRRLLLVTVFRCLWFVWKLSFNVYGKHLNIMGWIQLVRLAA
jgi:hypothetical protein